MRQPTAIEAHEKGVRGATQNSQRGQWGRSPTVPDLPQLPAKFTVATSLEDVPVESVTVSRKVYSPRPWENCTVGVASSPCRMAADGLPCGIVHWYVKGFPSPEIDIDPSN